MQRARRQEAGSIEDDVVGKEEPMAIAVHLQWPGVNADQYDRLKDHVG